MSSPSTSPAQPSAPGDLFDYFTAIEDRFNARRGSLLLLSTLDWALIETWREAGVPLQAVLRGIDQSFDRYEARAQRAAAGRSRLRKVNGLAWCAQAVMEAAEQIVDASTGLPAQGRAEPADSGFAPGQVAAFVEGNAQALEKAAEHPELRSATPAAIAARETIAETATRLRELGARLRASGTPPLDELDRTLTVLEERMLAAVRAAAPEAQLQALRATADEELRAVRARLQAVQARQVREQFIGKRLLEAYGLPRLSLFYMKVGE